VALVKCPRCAARNNPTLGICFTCGASLAELGPGSILSERYEILEQIGKGGMGQIFKAFDRTLGEVIALKVLHPELTQSEEMVKRFRNEVRLARKIIHRNVASLYEYGVSGHLQYISMELLEGVTLRRTLLTRGRGLDWAEAFGAVIGLAAGLQAIHDAGVIHRDLKTENIIIDAGVVRLMDFGIAKGMAQKAGAPLTRAGMILGTPQFMSPEQCESRKLDARSDIYSLGIVSWEIFTARLPFDDPNPIATMMLQIEKAPPLDLATKQGLPEAMVPVMRRVLAKSPDERFANAGDFQREVERARDESRTAVADRVWVTREPNRRGPRSDVSIRCRLVVVDEKDRITDHEVTLADNIGGGGVRVRTGIAGLRRGQLINFEELGGAFHARARVCGYSTGPDRLLRAHLEFVGSPPAQIPA